MNAPNNKIFALSLLVTTLLPIVGTAISQTNGNSWEIYNTGLGGGNIQAIVVDPDDPNIVYVGTRGGGFFWTDNYRTPYPSWYQKNKNLACWNILCLLVKKNIRRIYAGTTQGIFYLDLDNIRNRNFGWKPYHKNNLADHTIFRLRNCQDDQYPSGFYALGYNNSTANSLKQLIIIKNNSDLSYVNLGFNSPHVSDVVPYRQPDYKTKDKLGSMFVATDDGVYRFHDYLTNPNFSLHRLEGVKINCMAGRLFLRSANDTAYAIYVGTPNGGKFTVQSNQEEPWKNFLTDSSIAQLEPWFSNTVISQQEAIVGIYAITENGHIFNKSEITYDNNQIWPEFSRAGLPPGSINSFTVFESMIDHPFAGTNNGIYFNSNITMWKSLNFKDLFAHRIHTIIHDTLDNYDRLWAGSDGMLFYNDLDKGLDWGNAVVFKHITTIASHPGGKKLYVGTKNQGVFWKEKENGYNQFNQGQLPDTSSITVLFTEKNDNPYMYVGTEDGRIYKRKESTVWENLVDLYPEKITSFALVSAQSSNFIYVSTHEKVYEIDTSPPFSSLSWNAPTYVNSLVFNHPSSVLFAGTSNGIKSHPIESAIKDDWDEYEHLSLTDNNVRQLLIIATEPSFNGVLYAMTSDSASRFSQIWRNIIGKDIEESTVDDDPGFKRQYGESFCVNLNDPNIVYMGTAGSGVNKYEFDRGSPPTIVISPQDGDFGDVPRGSKASGSITITNNNGFSPLLVTFKIDDDTNFEINSSKTLIVYPNTNQSGSFSFTFNPHNYEKISGNLHVYWRDIFLKPVQQDSLAFELTGTGKGADLILDGSADNVLNYTFKAHVDHFITKTLEWKKQGNVNISDFVINGPNDTHFRLIPSNWENEFNRSNSGTISIRFDPTEIDPIQDIISIKYSLVYTDSTMQKEKIINLLGIGLDAILSMENNKVNFGEIPENDYSLEKKVYLENSGNIPLIFSKEPVIRPANNAFICKSSLPETLDYGDGGDFIKLVFHPDKIESFKSELIIFHEDSGISSIDSTIIFLEGKGDTNMVAPFPIEALDFDTVHVKNLRQESKEDTLDITNISTKYQVWVDSIYLSDNDAFKILNDHKFVLDSAEADYYDTAKIFIEFFADEQKDDLSLLDKHQAILHIKYRYGIKAANSTCAIRMDTLNGFMISSIRKGEPTIWQPTIPIYDTIETIFIFGNSGNIPLFRQFIGVPTDTAFVHELSFQKIDTIEPNVELADTIKFSPIDTTTQRDSIKIHFWDLDDNREICISDTVTISLIGNGVDRIRPKIETVNYSPLIWHQPCTVSAKVYDEHSGLREDPPQLFIRKGGRDNFSPLKMEVDDSLDTKFYAVIPGDSITARGIEFFIEAVDNSNIEGHYPSLENEFRYLSPPVKITSPGITKTKGYTDDGEIEFLHGGDAQQDYRLISIPLDSLNQSTKIILSESFGLKDYIKFRWSCADYKYNPDDGKTELIEINNYSINEPFSEFSPGKSFFLLINYRYPRRHLKRQTGVTLSTSQKFRIPLHPGWNFIANPYNFPIPIKNIALEDGNKYTLYVYDGNRENIDSLDISKQFLLPWEGNAIYAKHETNLLICPNLNPEYGPTELSKPAPKINYDWYISINASCEQAQDVDNIAAVFKNASKEIDDFDQVEPLPIGEYVTLFFKHPERKKASENFAIDVKPPSGQGNLWDFSVRTNIKNSEIELCFNQLNSVPDDFQILLVSNDLNILQNLRENNEFVYQTSNNFSVKNFRLLVGTDDFIADNNLNIQNPPSNFRLSVSYPNPFSISTEIKYVLPRQEQVTILIYNVLGELVKKVDQKIQASGKHNFVWDGTDQNNVPVRNGVYFCKFFTPNFSKTVKMTLIR